MNDFLVNLHHTQHWGYAFLSVGVMILVGTVGGFLMDQIAQKLGLSTGALEHRRRR